MRMIASLALIAAQLAAPAQAAELVAERGQLADSRIGAFAGARLRIDLDGDRNTAPRLGLVASPIHQSRFVDGRRQSRFAEGAELALTGREPARLSVAGLRVGAGGPAPDGDNPRLGLSTLEVAGIAAGVIVLGFVTAALLVRNDEGCCE